MPCKYNVDWNGISREKRLLIVSQNGKQALIDFDDNVIIPPKYYEIRGLDKLLLTVREGDRQNYKEGLVTFDGTVIVPPSFHRISWCNDGRILCCSDGNCEMLEIVFKRDDILE